jgi:hypothetical protein
VSEEEILDCDLSPEEQAAKYAPEEPFQMIETEDVMEARVVRHHNDVVVVFDNPRRGRDPKYVANVFDEVVHPEFTVTHKGFQFYVSTTTAPSQDSDEPVFTGVVETERHRTPRYHITVKL